MSSKCYPRELRIKAIKHITQRGHPVAEAASRIGNSQRSLNERLKRYSLPPAKGDEVQAQAAEMQRPKVELLRID